MEGGRPCGPASTAGRRGSRARRIPKAAAALLLALLPAGAQAYSMASSPFSGAYRSRSVQASPPDKLMQQHCDSTLLSETYQVIRVGQTGLEFRSGYSAPTILGSGLGDEEPLALAYSSFHGYFTGQDIFAGAFHGSTKCTGQFMDGRAILYCPVANTPKARCILSFECFAGPCYDPNYVAPIMGRRGTAAPSYLQVLWRRLGFLGCATVLGVGLSGVLVAMCVQWFADRTTAAGSSGASVGAMPSALRHSASVSKLAELATGPPETSKPAAKRMHRRGKSDLGTSGGTPGLDAPLLPGARDDPSLIRMPSPSSLPPPPPPPPPPHHHHHHHHHHPGLHNARSLPHISVPGDAGFESHAPPLSAPERAVGGSLQQSPEGGGGLSRSSRPLGSDANLNRLLLDHLEREKQAFLQAAERARHGDASALEGFGVAVAPRPARPAPKRRALGLQLDAWDANEIAGLAFGTALVMLALASPLFDDAVARDQRRDLGLCEACGGIGCDACGGTGKLKR